MDPTLPPLLVTPAALTAAAADTDDAAADTARAGQLAGAARLTSTDVGAEGASLAAAAARLTTRLQARLDALASDLDADAARLRCCAAGYVSSDTAAADALGALR